MNVNYKLYKAFEKLFCLFLFLGSIFVFAACKFSSGSDSSESFEQKNEFVIVRGIVDVKGSVPAIYDFSDSTGSSLEIDSKSRSALLSLPNSVVYSVTATSASGESASSSQIVGGTFEIKLTAGRWTLSAEIRKDGELILSGTTTDVLITAEKPVVDDILIIARPLKTSGETGTVNLAIARESDTQIKNLIASWIQNGVENFQTLSFSTDSVDFTMNAPVETGSYNVTFRFYSDSGMILYSCSETVNVFAGLCTDCWKKDGTSASSPYLSEADGKAEFKLTKKIVDSFAQTILYVQGTGASYTPITAAADSNNGTYFAPLSTVQAAVDRIVQVNDGSTKYSIFIDGTVTAPETPNSSTTLHFIKIEPQKTLNLTIASLSSTQAVINANKKAGVIDVIGESGTEKTTLVLQNVCITGGKTQSSGVGGGLKAQYADITLKAGTVIGTKLNPDDNGNSSIASFLTYGNYAAKGGGIYLNGCTLTMENDVYICQNYSENEGGGIAAEGNSTIIAKGGIIGFNLASSGGVGGGGIYINGGSCELTACTVCMNETSGFGNGGGVYISASTTFTMTGGTIYGNKHGTRSGYEFGNGIYVDGTLNLSGNAYIAPDNDVYLASGKFVTVIGELTGTLPVATLTPNAYDDSRTMLQSGGSYTLQNADCSKFAVTKDSVNNKLYSVFLDASSNAGILKESKIAVSPELPGIRFIPSKNFILSSLLQSSEQTISFAVQKKVVSEDGETVEYIDCNLSELSDCCIALMQNGSEILSGTEAITLKSWLPEGTYSLYMTATVDGIEYSAWEAFIIASQIPISYLSSAPDARYCPSLAAETGEDFKKLDEWMQNGSTLEGITITLTGNIDLTAETDWKPIGFGAVNDSFSDTNAVPFKGTLDGNGKSIKLQVAAKERMIGLVQINDGIIENLVVEQYTEEDAQLGDDDARGSRGGAFCGINNGIIRNCVNKAGLKSYTYWGIAGICYINKGTIENCLNTGTIEITTPELWAGAWTYNAGIAAENYGSIKNCVNAGEILTKKLATDPNYVNYFAGTVAGRMYGDALISNCYWLKNSLIRNGTKGNECVTFVEKKIIYDNEIIDINTIPDPLKITGCGYFESFTASAAITAGDADSCKSSQTLSYGTTLIDALNSYVNDNSATKLKQWQTAEDGTITLGF